MENKHSRPPSLRLTHSLLLKDDPTSNKQQRACLTVRGGVDGFSRLLCVPCPPALHLHVDLQLWQSLQHLVDLRHTQEQLYHWLCQKNGKAGRQTPSSHFFCC